MTTTTRRTLAGLAAVAIVLIAGGLMFDRHETRAYSECLDENRLLVSGSYNLPDIPSDPDVYTGNLYYLPGCEAADRAGLVAAGISAATAYVWWRRSTSHASGGE